MSPATIGLFDTPLDPKTSLQLAENHGAGAIVLFVGTVRNQTQGRPVIRLEFEAYAPMALLEMEKIAAAATAQWDLHQLVIHHRIGHLGIGDIAVVIAASAPHRAAAFDACEYAIDTLKKTVPIWKKEIFADGAIWVAAHP